MIRVMVGATGLDAVKGVASKSMHDPTAAEDTRFGTLIAPNLVAPNHDHFFNYRLDFDVDGQANMFTRTALVPGTAPEGSKRLTFWETRDEVPMTELEGRYRVAVARVDQDDPRRHAGSHRDPDLRECDLRLGREADIGEHPGLAAPHRIRRPDLRQIQPIGDRQAGVALATDSVTATWQLSCLPSCPQYCRVTPTECRPFLGTRCRPIHASTGRMALDRRQHPIDEPSQAPHRPTTASAPRNAAVTDAWPKHEPARSMPRSARRSCARPASSAQAVIPQRLRPIRMADDPNRAPT